MITELLGAILVVLSGILLLVQHRRAERLLPPEVRNEEHKFLIAHVCVVAGHSLVTMFAMAQHVVGHLA